MAQSPPAAAAANTQPEVGEEEDDDDDEPADEAIDSDASIELTDTESDTLPIAATRRAVTASAVGASAVIRELADSAGFAAAEHSASSAIVAPPRRATTIRPSAPQARAESPAF